MSEQMPRTQEELYDLIKAKFAPPETEKGLLPLLSLLASNKQGQMLPNPQDGTARQRGPKSVVPRMPDTGKIENNLARNEIIANHPGLGGV